MWRTIKEAADMLGVSTKTIRRRLNKCEWESKYEATGKGRGGKTLFIRLNHFDDNQMDTPFQMDKSNGHQMDKKCQTSARELIGRDTEGIWKRKEPATLQTQNQGPELRLPVLSSDEIRTEYEVPEKYKQEARLKAQLCEKILRILADSKLSKKQTWAQITDAYNNKLLVAEIWEHDQKEKSARTLKRWLKSYVDAGHDFSVLAKSYKISEKGRAVTKDEQDMLLKLLLSPSRVSVGSAIRKLKQFSRAGMTESTASEATLRRWVDDWKKSHLDIWTLHREGEKFFKEQINKTILRDLSLLKPGDVWVADGHVLNFEIIDIDTGKPKRMMMVMFYDWASRMPVGASIANTENSEHISAALRNSIMNVGYAPKVIYLDNGRAFRSRLFHKKADEHDLEKELGGLYERLGCQVVFAKAYNAKAKNIERFFLTFQEDFERYIESFRGSSIADKPARLARNEKWLQNLHNGEPLEMKQVKGLITLYTEKMYGLTPHRGIAGQPAEVLANAEIAPERYIAPAELNYLMLDRGMMRIRNNGIYFSTIRAWFYHPEMMKHVGQKVLVKYDFFNLTSILIYDENNRLICQATERELQDPMLALSKNEANGEKLKREIAEIRRNEKKARSLAEQEKMRIDEAVGGITERMQEQIAKDSDELFCDDPKLQIPTREDNRDVDEKIADLEEYQVLQEETIDKEEEENRKLKEALGL
jgi:putative transposase